ncbi:MAG: helix-turn-helix domain-containing protein [Fimbriimonadaceae bacterium]|nr:helix-turn-helix domain-containing protein [Fimbriimonadaceae bacterium]
MDVDGLSSACKALADPTRVRVLRFLLRCDCTVALGERGEVRPLEGPTVGDVCCSLDGAPSTLSFHLKELRAAGLITTEKRGRHILCAPRRDSLRDLAGTLELFAESGELAAKETTHG